MAELTFDNIASCGLPDDDQADVLGHHLATALEHFHEHFGGQTGVRVSFVIEVVELQSSDTPGSSENTPAELAVATDDSEAYAEVGEPFLIEDDDGAACGVQIGICVLPIEGLADQEGRNLGKYNA